MLVLLNGELSSDGKQLQLSMKDNLYLGIIIPFKKGSKYIFHLFNVHIITSQCLTLNKEFSFIKEVETKKWKNPCYFLFCL